MNFRDYNFLLCCCLVKGIGKYRVQGSEHIHTHKMLCVSPNKQPGVIPDPRELRDCVLYIVNSGNRSREVYY
jgi:hypothetical protein